MNYVNHILKGVAYDDSYRKILEDFKDNNSPVILSDNDIEYVTNVLKSQQKEFQKVISL